MNRFFGSSESRRRLEAALAAHDLVGGDKALSAELAGAGAGVAFGADEAIITQDETSTDIFFIIAGSVKILVQNREVAVRESPTHVGEMALIDPTKRRSATVIATKDVVSLKITEEAFSSIAARHPDIWRRLALEMAERLRGRGLKITPPNVVPHVFIASSKEGLSVANAIHAKLDYVSMPRVWTDNVFQPSSSPILDLLENLEKSDFAVVVLGADDRVVSRHEQSMAPRDNVLFELGLAMGRLGRERSFIVTPRDVDIKIPTDLLGINALSYSTDGDIAARIHSVCADISGVIKRLGPR